LIKNRLKLKVINLVIKVYNDCQAPKLEVSALLVPDAPRSCRSRAIPRLFRPPPPLDVLLAIQDQLISIDEPKK
jgi:hypothetical protein